MTIITLPTANIDTARAALAEALAAYGPPVTIRQPGLPDLTIGVSGDKLCDRMARFWAHVYQSCARDGSLSAPAGGAERGGSLRGRAASISAPPAGAETTPEPGLLSSFDPLGAARDRVAAPSAGRE